MWVRREGKKPSEAKPAPPPPPSLPAPAPPKRQGSPFGSPLGASSSRTVIGVEDPDFTFGYYLDRVAAVITGNLVRPKVEERVEALFYFRIERDGTVTALELRQSSGLMIFDEAARRAIETSSPLPPLPRGYKKSYLGINLVVK